MLARCTFFKDKITVSAAVDGCYGSITYGYCFGKKLPRRRCSKRQKMGASLLALNTPLVTRDKTLKRILVERGTFPVRIEMK